MTRSPTSCLLPLLAAAVLLAGCGGSSASSSSSGAGAATSATTGSTATLPTSSTTSTPTSSTASTPARTGSTSSTGTSTKPHAPAGAAAVASCKRGVRSLPHLKQSTTERLETICEKAASGDVNAKRKAAEEACRELVNASPLPAGEAKERALAACRNAGGAKGAGGK
jgi:hypothetical protein